MHDADDLAQTAIVEVIGRCTDPDLEPYPLKKVDLNRLACCIARRRWIDKRRRRRKPAGKNDAVSVASSQFAVWSDSTANIETLRRFNDLCDAVPEFGAVRSALIEGIKEGGTFPSWEEIGKSVNECQVKLGKARPLRDDEALSELGRKWFAILFYQML